MLGKQEGAWGHLAALTLVALSVHLEWDWGGAKLGLGYLGLGIEVERAILGL